MEERRKFIRLSTRLHATYQVIGTEDTLTSLTRNVGGGGLSLFTESRLAPGTVLKMQVTFPQRTAPVHFSAEVIWSGPLLLEGADRRPDVFETGVRFRQITPRDRAVVMQYAAATRSAAARPPQG